MIDIFTLVDSTSCLVVDLSHRGGEKGSIKLKLRIENVTDAEEAVGDFPHYSKGWSRSPLTHAFGQYKRTRDLNLGTPVSS